MAFVLVDVVRNLNQIKIHEKYSFWKQEEHKGKTFPLAVAIVLSGMYEDDLDNAEDVLYTGQGGHDLTGNKRQIQDQKMERGNLALKVCILKLSHVWTFFCL